MLERQLLLDQVHRMEETLRLAAAGGARLQAELAASKQAQESLSRELEEMTVQHAHATVNIDTSPEVKVLKEMLERSWKEAAAKQETIDDLQRKLQRTEEKMMASCEASVSRTVSPAHDEIEEERSRDSKRRSARTLRSDSPPRDLGGWCFSRH